MCNELKQVGTEVAVAHVEKISYRTEETHATLQ